MEKHRNSLAEIKLIDKTVEFCGKTIRKSKKRVKWVLKHREKEHIITCTISFMSGKKLVVHNGMTIVKTTSSEEVLTTTIMLGVQKVMMRVEKESEGIKIQSIDSTHEIENAFCKFRNIMSGPPTDIYGKFYGRDT